MGKHEVRSNKGKKKPTSKKKNLWLKILIPVVVIVGIAVFAFATTANKNQQQIEDKSTLVSVQSSPVASSDTGIKNDLTGLPISADKQNRRPIAVMINNIEQAQPLLGVSQADLMYECLVEGAITRIMAVFKDPTGIPMIGSVRSARPYFINIANGHNAIYCHVGGSTQALEMLNNGVIDSFDLGVYTNMMWRDENRRANLGYEHSAVTSGDKLLNGIASSNVSLDYEKESVNKQKFGSNSQVLKGESCNKLTATFSYYKDTVFDYDTATSSYKISQFGSAQMDGSAGVQNSKKNVLAIYVDTHNQDEGTLLQEMVLSGKGDGYYASNGKVIKIKWTRSSPTTNFEFYDEQSSQLIMLPGQTYICCVPLTGSVSYS